MTNKNATKLLIIDDDVSSIKIITHILSQRGYTLQAAQSGSEGLNIVENFLPDLILLDVLMPEKDGYDVCHKLKNTKKYKDIPVVFITSSSDPRELARGFAAGGVDFITKPVNSDELLARVTTHLALKQSIELISRQNIALNEEINQRKQTEEKFRTLSEMTFEAIIFLKDNKVLEANKAAKQIFGLIAKGDDVVSPDSELYRQFSGLVEQISLTGEGNARELTLKDKEGREFFALVHHRSITYLEQQVDVLAIRDISLQKEMDKKVFNAILETEERERKRFSSDMHDGLGAHLSALKIYLNLFGKGVKKNKEKILLLDEMKTTINQAINTSRTIANNIMPSVLIDYGLVKAISVFAESLEKTGAIKIGLSYPDGLHISDEITQTHIYRIVMELINNTLKHAKASQISIKFSTDTTDKKRLCMEYSDDGKGFDYNKIIARGEGGQGLANITNRLTYLHGEGGFQPSESGKAMFLMKIPI